MSSNKQHSIAIFASDEGAGDPERGSIMAEAGSFLAMQNAQFICFAQKNSFCAPLITALNNAGGEVTIFCEQDFTLPSGLNKIKTKMLSSNEKEKYQQINEASDAFIALPGSLLSAKSLFEIWVATDRKKPVALLNKNRAFEFMRGFGVDVVSHKVKKIDQHILFSDNIEDLWHRLNKALSE